MELMSSMVVRNDDARGPVAGLPVLALNSGSSSLKFGLYRVGPTQVDTLLSGESESFSRIMKVLENASELPTPLAIGHRVVHGGPSLRHHCLIDDSVMTKLEAATAFAPLHTPATLSVIRCALERFPAAAQAACFDTAFHADMPDVARVLAIPRELQLEGIHRYGFHGLSLESILHQLGDSPPKRVVVAHLGNGASVTAVKEGKSIDTSMGLTPAGGLVMGTRSGDLDPGVLIYLMRQKALDPAAIEVLINRRSGLLGISGIGSDMRSLHEAASTKPDARLAVQMFCYTVRKQVAAMIAVLDGVDLIVFTGGIGENDARVRAEICRGLSWIGVSLDEGSNRSHVNPVNDSASRCAVQVLASQEDEQIARHTWALTATVDPNRAI